MTIRCDWAQKSEILTQYHDIEWGVPLFDDRKLFEFLVLDAFQAGLSWEIMLKKRIALRNAFKDYDYNIISNWGENEIATLINDATIIRNKHKIKSIIQNSKCYIEIQIKYNSFSNYIWGFTEGSVIRNAWTDIRQIPTKTELSDKISKDMKQKGFSFVGSTICYSFMQAIGMVNDHLTKCFRYNEI